MREQMEKLLRNVMKVYHERGKETGKVQEKLRKHIHAEAEKDRIGEEINSEEKNTKNTAVISGKHHDRNEGKDTKYS